MVGIRSWFFLPLTLLALCLFTLCVVVAVSLFRQQATLAEVFKENVGSRRAAVELEECLTDLIALEQEHVESVAVLHKRVRKHLNTIAEVADQPNEKELYSLISTAFGHYIQMWDAMPLPSDPRHESAFREATRFLATEVLRPCTEFRLFNGRQVEVATENHELVLRQLAWGMAGIGGLGGVAGLALGLGIARGLSRSIRRVQVRIRDAAGKLSPDLPEIVLTGDGDFRDLHEQVDHLTSRIEDVVQELQEREHEVLRAEQLAAVGQLAAGVGHEIRNPLTSIKMLVQSALEGRGQSDLAPEDLRVIESEVRRMEGSLQTFLAFARPPKPERVSVELHALIANVLGLIRGRAEKQCVVTQVDAPDGPLCLAADPGQLQQVLVNLVLNALDAMPGGGLLRLVVHPSIDRVVVEVTDTGPGIAADMLPRLFEPFASSKETGLGLGLVISRRIVEDHGGSIEASNSLDGGASIIVTLPTVEPARAR
jgi:C4-dicarboxylate-specific signal transduction histidine kinase